MRNWTYLPEYHACRETILDAVDKVCQSGTLILGSQVEAFEREWASYLSAGHGIGVNSGTDALFLGLKALGVKSGDEVITGATSPIPTISAILMAGAFPVLVDVDLGTHLLDLSRIASRITSNTRVILPVHLYGQAVDMEALMNLSGQLNLFVLEDCAQAHGCELRGRKVGTIGHIGAWSFYPTKPLGAYGDAGMVTTNRNAYADRLRSLRQYGQRGGINSRLDEIQAAILRVKLKRFESDLESRRRVASIYGQELRELDSLTLPERSDSTHSWYAFVVRVPSMRRDEVMRRISEQDVAVRTHFPIPVHCMKDYSFLGYQRGDFPVAERLAEESFSLPMHAWLTDQEIRQVVRAVKGALR